MAEFGDFLISPEDSLKDIDVECLDFEYVKTCTDAEKLKGIVAVLRSGKEGSYPEVIISAYCFVNIVYYFLYIYVLYFIVIGSCGR